MVVVEHAPLVGSGPRQATSYARVMEGGCGLTGRSGKPMGEGGGGLAQLSAVSGAFAG